MAENGAVSDFQLSDEVLSVIPKDPYEQLDLARKITSLAIASRVSKLETEASSMRKKIVDKDRSISELQARIVELETLFRETDMRLRAALEENIKLTKERDSLVASSKKMSRDLAKMEKFKRHLMQSLKDESGSATETVDIGTCEQSLANAASLKGDGSIGFLSNPVTASIETDSPVQAGRITSNTSNITPQIIPTTVSKVTSTGGSPRGFSTVVSPKMTYGATSPTKTNISGCASLSPWYPSSMQSSAANSPPRQHSLPGRSPRIDGKEFFRQARSRLSYEQFAAFLANIKELNVHRQSREEALKKAEEIFGADNKDLFLYFQGLLNRNLP